MIRRSQHSPAKGEQWSVTLIPSWQGGSSAGRASAPQRAAAALSSSRGEVAQQAWGPAQPGWTHQPSAEAEPAAPSASGREEMGMENTSDTPADPASVAKLQVPDLAWQNTQYSHAHWEGIQTNRD